MHFLCAIFAVFCTCEAEVARIGTTEYGTLAAAFAAVPSDGTQTIKDMSGTTVKLLKGITTTTEQGFWYTSHGGNPVLTCGGFDGEGWKVIL